MTWLISDEARKHRAFREVWVSQESLVTPVRGEQNRLRFLFDA